MMIHCLYVSARDFGTLIPQMKEYSRDMNPDIKVNPKELIAIMRPGMSIHIKGLSLCKIDAFFFYHWF